MERIKLPGVTEEARELVHDARTRELRDEEIRAKNKRIMLTALINKGIFGTKTTSHRHPRRKR